MIGKYVIRLKDGKLLNDGFGEVAVFGTEGATFAQSTWRDSVVEQITGYETKLVPVVECRVSNGIVSWWRLGEDAPFVARSVGEFEIEKTAVGYNFVHPNLGSLEFSKHPMLGCSYDIETGEVYNG